VPQIWYVLLLSISVSPNPIEIPRDFWTLDSIQEVQLERLRQRSDEQVKRPFRKLSLVSTREVVSPNFMPGQLQEIGNFDLSMPIAETG